jgi:hypothetical protein
MARKVNVIRLFRNIKLSFDFIEIIPIHSKPRAMFESCFWAGLGEYVTCLINRLVYTIIVLFELTRRTVAS